MAELGPLLARSWARKDRRMHAAAPGLDVSASNLRVTASDAEGQSADDLQHLKLFLIGRVAMHDPVRCADVQRSVDLPLPL